MPVNMSRKQVEASHYSFSSYMSKRRWISVWHQLDEVQKLAPEKVLEVGPGSGLYKCVAGQFGLHVETVDLDPELKPDHLASVTALPFESSSYSVVCAFQVLEHLPYEEALRAFREMVRVSQRFVLISLPDAQPVWRYVGHIPRVGEREVLVRRPRLRPPSHVFDGEHFWEIGKRNYPLSMVIRDFSAEAALLKTYRVGENAYHRFFLFEKRGR